jgi:hypothetical protein
LKALTRQLFSKQIELRPYQQEAAKAIFDSILNSKGLTFSVEIARQGGENELSAHIEVLLLTMFIAIDTLLSEICYKKLLKRWN